MRLESATAQSAETIRDDCSVETICDEFVTVDSTLVLLRINGDVGAHKLRPCST